MNRKINIASFKNLYFIGIGGIGMSALARYFSTNGKQVAGYDRSESEITNVLQKIKIHIHFDDAVDKIPKVFLNPNDTLIIYTPAIPKNHKEFNYFKDNGFTILKRAAVLGLVTHNNFCFAVAGTHGKTTTSTILGHILKETVNATSFLGGISENYNSNLILGNDKITVVEADEYDRSFLELSPNIACITSMDADHLDIYGEAETLEKTFIEFSKKVSDTLFVKSGLPIQGMTYGIEDDSDYRAENIRFNNGISVFDVKTPKAYIENVNLQLLGRHNISNALVALAMAYSYGISLEAIKKSLASFKGIQRRFNIKINTEELILIDDYAHHPTEINAVFETLKNNFPKRQKVVVFQPHLFSRTKDFAENFAKALAKFDSIFLLDIYPARELPIKGINSSWLLEKIKKQTKNVRLIASESDIIISEIKKEKNAVVAMLGAGDIGVLIGNVCKELLNVEKLKVKSLNK
jgi:UDP-N-acetylmuramate--alanine ligase